MSGPNLPSPKNLFGSPVGLRYNQQYGVRQPMYLQQNSPYMSPRGSRLSSPRNNLGSPDFIPLGISSPVGIARHRHSWNSHNYSSNSFTSNSSTPPSSNSSFNSPYRRNNFRGNFRRGKNNFNSSGSSSPHISVYVHKDMLKDPWAELEKKLEDKQSYQNYRAIEGSEDTTNSDMVESDQDSSDSNNLSSNIQ